MTLSLFLVAALVPNPCRDALIAAHPGVAWSADTGLVADVTFDKKPERIYWGRADSMFVIGIIECDRDRPAGAWKFELAPMECPSGAIVVTLERPEIPQTHYDDECLGLDERLDCIELATLMERVTEGLKSYKDAKGLRIGPRECDAFHLFWDPVDRRFRAWQG